MMFTVGNRPEWHFEEIAAALAPCFDQFICYELADYLRGRKPGEVADLLRAGLLRAGVSADRIELAQDYEEATCKLAQQAGEGDLLVILMGGLHQYLPIFEDIFEPHRKS